MWPASRKRRPKQFLPILDGGRTLLGATVERVQGLVPDERILVVTAADQVDEVLRTAPSVPRENIVIEPQARNTAPCIGLGALEVLRRDPAAVLAVLPSDQWVRDAVGYRATLARAIDVARDGAIVTIGIVPTAPETGFGYLEVGAETERGARVVERFVEKPDRATAEKYLAARRYLWNSGMFFFACKRLLETVRMHMPELASILHAIEREPERTAELYPQAPSVSIDYGVMEKLPRGDVFCVPGEFGWNDVGSWSALGELRPHDADGNTIATENGVTVDARGNILYSDGKRVIAAIGVEDLVIVATDDAILVMPRSRAQDVREVVKCLETTNRKEFL
ncbi:MAG: Mannose-phosphate guanylyltransferase [Myxococcales bacterium]|nr:Mannose-phosphate guanylyltransferase [Myxococcales bacterium]